MVEVNPHRPSKMKNGVGMGEASRTTLVGDPLTVNEDLPCRLQIP